MTLTALIHKSQLSKL